MGEAAGILTEQEVERLFNKEVYRRRQCGIDMPKNSIRIFLTILYHLLLPRKPAGLLEEERGDFGLCKGR